MSPPYPPSRRSTGTVVVAVVLVVVVALSGIGLAGFAGYQLLKDGRSGASGDSSDRTAPPPPPSATVPMPSYPAALRRFYEQRLDWTGCGSYECALLSVPLDYAEPDGKTIDLAVLRVPATQRSRRIGQLVVDPGGPGASAVQYAAAGALAFGPTVARYFDLVGMDPRGVGQSTPLECLSTGALDEFFATDPSPDDVQEVGALDGQARAMGEGCVAESGDLARHVSTVEAARDMDVLRAALGEPQLDYLGASYGTFLGATYADLFPKNVRRMVLDGAVDPSLSTIDLALGQARGFQTALQAYVEDCVAGAGCPLGDDADAALARIRDLLDQLDAEPLETGTDRRLTEGLATNGVIYPLYVKTLWPQLTAALSAAIERDDGAPLLALSDRLTHRGASAYDDNSSEALYAVNCLDHDDAIPSSRVPAYLDRFEAASPTFGRTFSWSISTCQQWPVHTGHVTKALHAAGAPPIVVVGTTRDPATPYAWAKALAGQLDSGRLVSRDGDGHTGFRQGNRCVDGAVEAYLVKGVAPRDGLSC
jgi:pimeloyl-ACP methyl ester carboxylesterase